MKRLHNPVLTPEQGRALLALTRANQESRTTAIARILNAPKKVNQ